MAIKNFGEKVAGRNQGLPKV